MAEKHTPKHQLEPVDKLRNFWDKYNKPITYISLAIILVVGGWIAYKYMYKLPLEEKANNQVFVTQKYFDDFTAATDSAKILIAAKVLNGDGVHPGALKIMNDYSGSSAANLCHYMAGACYLHLGQFDKAINYLKDFKANGATIIESRAYGMMGDASAELNKVDDALNYYKKAASVNEKDDFTTSEFLFRAALYAEVNGKTKEAIDLFKKIKSDYPKTPKAEEVDRYLAKLGEVSE